MRQLPAFCVVLVLAQLTLWSLFSGRGCQCECELLQHEIRRLTEQLRIERKANKELVTRAPPLGVAVSPCPSEEDRGEGRVVEVPVPVPVAAGGGRVMSAPVPEITVVMMSYPKSKRFHRLEALLRRVRAWDFVAEVLLVWNGEPSLLPPQIEALVSKQEGAPIRLLPQTSNRLDNRWRVGRVLRTEGVLNIDDDVDLPYNGAKCMLDVWRAAPLRLVAVDVRAHSDSPAAIRTARKRSGMDPGNWAYSPRHVLADGRKAYSIALPRALMGHREHWLHYDSAASGTGDLRRIVDDLLCDDIAFNFVASNTSGAGPVYARAAFAPYRESQAKDSLQKMAGMRGRRQSCVSELAKALGRMPLRYEAWHASCLWNGESGDHRDVPRKEKE
eukprot:Hpha_TRINITY_DN34033_c0_g1::TRINITY_DN34033_c0_g1_i1::g.30508::m.30508